MPLTITPLYAAALGLMLIGFTIQVIIHRARADILLLHGEDMDLALSIRRHGNFIENAPLALILLAFAELAGAPAWLLHAAGASLLISRAMHPIGLSYKQGAPIAFRILGMVGTWAAMLAAIAYLAWVAL